jgi:hypothetical protein
VRDVDAKGKTSSQPQECDSGTPVGFADGSRCKVTASRGCFPMYSVVQVLLVAPVVGMCVRLLGGCSERDVYDQRRTRRSEVCASASTLQYSKQAVKGLQPFRLRMLYMPPRRRFPPLSESVAVWHVSVYLECRP